MNESDETLERENSAVLKAIADLSKKFDSFENRFGSLEKRFGSFENRIASLENRFDSFENRIGSLENRFDSLENRFDSLENRFDSLEKNVTTHFEVIREGISYNSARFDRLEAKVYDARSDISNLRADIKEMSEQIRRHIIKDTLVLK